jgi:hypothetical protein
MAALLWMDAASIWLETRPVFGAETLLVSGALPRRFDYPFAWQKAPRTTFVLVQPIRLPRLHPADFEFYPQDFLWAVSVNGENVPAPGLPLSGASREGRSIDLSRYLHSGDNEIELRMQVRFGEAGFLLSVSPWDTWSLALLGLAMGATVATAFAACTLCRVNLLQPEMLIFLAGVGLRYLYVSGTPYFVRSFDYWGHADYLDFIIQHSALPPPGSNWEAFQPPLYYLVVAGLSKICLALGLPVEMRYGLWQGFSTLCSVGVLLAGWWVARIIYEIQRDRRFYMLGVIAVAPPLVFNAARVSNDGLLALLAFLWLALLLHFWRRPATGTWLGLSVVTGLALLTKASALSLWAMTVLVLVFDRRFPMRRKLAWLLALVVVPCALAGVYYLPRALHATALNTYVVGNLSSLNYHGRIDGVLIKSLTFNPFKVVRYPFDETWGPRHDYFPEVFFKTMFLGEWIKGAPYKLMARMMMIVALLLIVPLVVGIYRAISRAGPLDFPLLLVLAGIFVAQWLFLQMAPYLSTQDFRYSVVLLVPAIHVILYGIYIRAPRWQQAFTFLLQWAMLNSAIYVALLALG